MTAAWILLTAFGFQLVVKVSSVTLIAFLLVLLWMVVDIISQSEQSFLQAMTFGTQLPAEAIAAMGLHDDTDKFIFCVNVLIGSAGALALVDGDFGRYARRSRDIGIAALAGNIAKSRQYRVGFHYFRRRDWRCVDGIGAIQSPGIEYL